MALKHKAVIEYLRKLNVRKTPSHVLYDKNPKYGLNTLVDMNDIFVAEWNLS